jgi:hypothetical protein
MRLRRGESRSPGRYLATIYCDGHSLDMTALRNYADDQRPCSVSDAVEAIRAGECPACRPRYLAEAAPQAVRQADGSLLCLCCGTSWDLEGDGWIAVVDNGLAVVDEIEPIPVGASIDSSWFRVCPVDPVGGPTDVLRAELLRFSSSDEAGVTDEAVIEDLVEGLSSAYGGKARADAEVYRVLADSGLDDEALDRWRAEAVVTLHDIRKLFGSIA